MSTVLSEDLRSIPSSLKSGLICVEALTQIAFSYSQKEHDDKNMLELLETIARVLFTLTGQSDKLCDSLKVEDW